MAKRKIDCSLDEIVGEYLKKKKFEKSFKLFEKVKHKNNDLNKTLERLFGYLKKTEPEKENMEHEDLGFEINFGVYQPEKKVSSINLYLLALGSSLFSFHQEQLIITGVNRRAMNKRALRKTSRRKRFQNDS